MTNTKFLTRTAASVALVVLAQLLGKVLPAGAVIAGPFSVTQLVTGSLVNCVLLSAAGINGVWSGVIVGLISPVLAFFLGIGPAIFAITPLVALGNAAIVVTARATNKMNKFVSVVISAAVKCAFLWVSVPALLRLLGAPEKQMQMMSVMFSWPQGVTALIGGLLALLVLRRYREQES